MPAEEHSNIKLYTYPHRLYTLESMRLWVAIEMRFMITIQLLRFSCINCDQSSLSCLATCDERCAINALSKCELNINVINLIHTSGQHTLDITSYTVPVAALQLLRRRANCKEFLSVRPASNCLTMRVAQSMHTSECELRIDAFAN